MSKKKRRHRKRLIARHQPIVGSAPGVLAPTTEGAQALVRLTRYSAAGIEELDQPTLIDIKAGMSDGAVTWLDVVGIENTDTLQTLGDALGIHPLALEDIAHVPQRPKADEYDNGVFIILKIPDEELSLAQVGMFVGQGFVATFQERRGECFETVRKRAKNPNSRLRQKGSGYLGYAIIDAAVDSYFPAIERIGEELELLEERLTQPASGVNAQAIQAQRREVLRLRREVGPLREAIRNFINEDVGIVDDETRPYLRDCEDHAYQLIEDLDTCGEMSAALMDLNISNASQRLNEVMKVLTIISTIFIPLSFIAGVYGMNFDTSASSVNMPELRWRFGYPAVLLLMFAIAAGLVVFFVRNGWIGGGRRRRDTRSRKANDEAR